MKSLSILLHGSYNGSNYGDILLAWLIKNIIEEEGVNCILNNASSYFHRILGKSGEHPLRHNLKGVDGVIFGGGGYLTTKKIGIRGYKLLLLTHLVPMLEAKRRNIPYAIVGVGSGPIHDPILQRISKYALNNAKLIILRNQESRDYLRKYNVTNGIKVTADLALAYTPNMIKIEDDIQAERLLATLPKGLRVFLHVNLYNPHGGISDIERGCEILVKELIKYAHDDENIVFIIGSDYESKQCNEINRTLHNMLPSKRSIVIQDYNPWTLSAIINRCDVIITTKLHVGIIATSFGKTVLSFSGDQKIKRFYEQINAGERCIELKSLERGDAYKQLKNFIYAEPINIEAQRELAYESLRFIKEFIKKLQKEPK
ncbi:polysaccharide pyruvyl transferase family protein [Phosphitispora fastidiosa]|uniref:polysaccharide pyruvyl transferase family protein n=1 Tax=Phosphitispora fastidiosa TaxID=2837202 RepID=UPI001E583EEA|nr:polysaccharide pyruvyl transferase family protein [Phosphitispora fastidiosa]MBU7007224.1 polysaccharide pyruvyl transferase WcaK-like protein [Phosphitispora fastidiosa]